MIIDNWIMIYLQVSVERSFFGLKFILSDHRNSMGDDIQENILIIRRNNA